MAGRAVWRVESPSDSGSEAELGKGRWSDLGMRELWEVSMSLRSGSCLEFGASACDA